MNQSCAASKQHRALHAAGGSCKHEESGDAGVWLKKKEHMCMEDNNSARGSLSEMSTQLAERQ